MTKEELARAIRATLWMMDDHATAYDALNALAREVESPHVCQGGWTNDDRCYVCNTPMEDAQ